MLSAPKFVLQKQPHTRNHTRNILPEESSSTKSTHGQHGSDANMPAKSMHLPSFAGKVQKSETAPWQQKEKMYSDSVTHGHHKFPEYSPEPWRI
jgi:hypothetical protein